MKVKFGLSNVHYAPIESYNTNTKKYTYGTIKPFPGAVNLTLNPQGSEFSFYADNINYFGGHTNAGYSGDYECAMIPDDFRKDILGDTVDANGVIVENSDAKSKEFALMFQFENDVSGRRHILWRCSAARPNIEGETKEEQTTPKTEKLSITVLSRENDHNVKAYVDDTSETHDTYESWFEEVYEPEAPAQGGVGG